ncbi:MAG: T9SS type A sorting domain-containing protein, partial [Verrucomicrobia bacterium]|nr:T9SS type A sorting domain-containing protein [Cytophagales bacterium]
LKQNVEVRLTLLDMQGREISVLQEQRQAAGDHAYIFEVGELTDGIYLYSLEAGGSRQIKRISVVK